MRAYADAGEEEDVLLPHRLHVPEIEELACLPANTRPAPAGGGGQRDGGAGAGGGGGWKMIAAGFSHSVLLSCLERRVFCCGLGALGERGARQMKGEQVRVQGEHVLVEVEMPVEARARVERIAGERRCAPIDLCQDTVPEP
jgi:hypothetical protein